MLHRVKAARGPAALVTVVLVLAACVGTSPSPSPTGTSSAQPPASPAPTPQLAYVLPDGVLPAGAWVTVSHGPLERYSWPWRESGSSGYIDESAELILGQTVSIDGEAWTEISGGGGGGWVPLKTLAASVTLKPVSCPQGSDLWAVAALSPWEQLSCFGGRELTLEGNEIIGATVQTTVGEPAWLNGVGDLVLTPDAGMRSLDLHVAPGTVALDRPAFETDVAPYRVRVTGHFNDAASVDCAAAPIALGSDEGRRQVYLDAAAQELACRGRFVLTSLATAGTAPAPSAPPSTVPAVLRVDRATDVTGGWPGLNFVVFADGRLVTARPDGWGWWERQLTDAALNELITSALGEKLLQRDAGYPPPVGYAAGFTTWSIQILRDTRLVRVWATNASQVPAAHAVIELGDALIEKVASLPATAFEGALHAWMPAAYDLEISLSPGVLDTYASPPAFPLWVEDAVLPLSTPLIETGAVVHEESGGTVRCSVIGPDEASRLRAAFYRAGYVRNDGSLVTAGFDLGWRQTNGWVGVRIIAAPPDEAGDYHCAAATW